MRIQPFAIGALLLGSSACAGVVEDADRAAAIHASTPVKRLPMPLGRRVGPEFAIVTTTGALTLETIAGTGAHLGWPSIVGARESFALALEPTPGETKTRGWVFATALPNRRTVVGFVDASAEAPSKYLRVLVSDDGGAEWFERTAIEKPNDHARFSKLRAVRNAHWEVDLELPTCADCEAQPGLYTFVTDNAAIAWREKETPLDTEDTIAPSDEANH